MSRRHPPRRGPTRIVPPASWLAMAPEELRDWLEDEQDARDAELERRDRLDDYAPRVALVARRRWKRPGPDTEGDDFDATPT